MDPITTALGNVAAEIAVEEALKNILSLGWKSFRWLPFKIFNPHSVVRVSCSSFLRIADENNKYLLIRNAHRPEFFGPLGGCYKYYANSAKAKLESFFYYPDPRIDIKDSKCDIRGFVRRNKTHDLFQWFIRSPNDHESAHECLTREIEEEIFIECGSEKPSNFNFRDLEFIFVRAFLEKSTMSGTKITQLRLFEIYDLSMISESARHLIKLIQNSKSQKLLWASRDEIESGRHDKKKYALGHAAVLFINDKLTRQDMPSHGTRKLP